MLTRTRKFTSVLIAIAIVGSNVPGYNTIAVASEVTVQSIENPSTSIHTGRYDEAQNVRLSTTIPNADIYYTLDGTLPSEKSLEYTNTPITISKTTNLSVIAVKDGVSSKGITFSYIIKTKEKPLLQFVAMSDVHIGSRESADPRYASYFDTISSIFPNPDAILIVGDMINDNGNDKPDDHVMVKDVFQQNLARKNWTDTTKIRLAIGNHDSTVAKVKQHYPSDWFTSQSNGYYESEIGGYSFIFLNGNNYNSDVAQRNWLKGRLAALTSDPKNINKPIFVNVHQPITGTVMDGLQTSNPNLYEDLKNYPQVVNLSGHSHLNINDDRSIYQKDFTSVNLGSMSYIEAEHGYSQTTEKGLLGRFEFPVSQADFIEVYANRIEVDRVALSADSGDVYDNWAPAPSPNSKGVSAGEKWVIELKGTTNAEVKANFKYTSANRNKVAPVFNSDIQVNNLDTVPMLHFDQAKDDQNMHHYEVNIIDRRTGTSAKSVNVFANQFFSPIPNAMNIPLEGLKTSSSYNVLVTAVDCYGNRSATLQQSFKTGGIPPELTPIDPATMWNQLVVDMKFDDRLKDDAKDVTSLASFKGNVSYVQGKSNKSVSIPAGNGNYIDLGSRNDLNFGSDSFTVSFWHAGNLAADQTIISNKNWNSGKNIGWYIGPASANSMTLNMSDGTNRVDYSAQSVGNEWHLYTVTVDREGKLAKVYVDDVEKASGNLSGLAANTINTPNNIIIGADGNKANGGATMMIDDLKIWKRSLSATEIKSLSDSYKSTTLYTFDQLSILISNTTEFQAHSASVVGVAYPKDKLSKLATQLELAKTITVNSSPADIDNAYIDLKWDLDTAKDSVVYTFIPKSSFTVESYSSYADNENALAANILDGDESTIWHSKWQAPVATFPHWVIIDTKETHLISGIRRTSRQSQSALEFPKGFELYASDRLSDLTDPTFLSKEENKSVNTFGQTWAGNSYKNYVALNKPIQGRYVRFAVTSTYNPTDLFTSMSEIDFTGEKVNVVAPSDNTLQMSFEDNYKDGSVNNLTATPQGNPIFIPGRIGKGLQINTTSTLKQYVNLGKPASLNFGTNTNFTLSLWLKSNSVSGDPAILSNKNWDSGKNTGYLLGLNGNNLRWNYNTAGGSRADADIPNVVDGSWHHVVVSHDRATGRVDFYKDGSPVAVSKVNGSNFAGIASTMTIAAQKGTIDAGLSTIIGNDGTGNYALPLNVQLDELTILRRTVTPQEVADMYNSAPPIQLNENFNGSINLIGAQHTVQGSEFRYNLDLRTPTMNARIDKAIVEIGYDAQAFEFVSASRATAIDNTTPGIVRLELPGGFVYNQTNPLEYSKSRLSELKFNTKASSGQGTIQVNTADFYNGSTKFKNESLNMQPQTIQIHNKSSEDLNKDGHVTIGDVA